MDELKNFEELLSAAKKIVEKIQVEKNFLEEENLKLREEIQNLLAENEKLRSINKTFGNNLQQLSQQFQFTIQNEFQKFLTAATFAGEKNFDGEKNLVTTQKTEIEILDAEENLPTEINQSKRKPVYAEFYAEEIGFAND